MGVGVGVGVREGGERATRVGCVSHEAQPARVMTDGVATALARASRGLDRTSGPVEELPRIAIISE